MKYLKTKNMYQASNVTFNLATREARSYAWWVFTKIIDGKLVFNEHRYSITTQGHQRKVKKLLTELNIPIDRVVDHRESL